MITLDKELKEALKMAAETEGLFKTLSFAQIEKYRQLERAGYVIFKKKAIGMGTAYLTEKGQAYFESLPEEG
ncbi:hypothetical protein [Paenibacillus chitinolyticus]|uniref:hypothetical protein n=1 Tax=Paenibacillus chitinolyticus TaxID=79263 RepID=UPI001C48C01C|nr:hypothetical protein [Paenibacillus chitinolyticus]MBV6717261.1 hypothetical protein [Paenibacillus chitinolyticus]